MCTAQDSNSLSTSAPSSAPSFVTAREEIDAVLTLFARDQETARLQAHIALGYLAARAAADSASRVTRAIAEEDENAILYEDTAQLRWRLARRELAYARVLQYHLADASLYLPDEE